MAYIKKENVFELCNLTQQCHLVDGLAHMGPN